MNSYVFHIRIGGKMRNSFRLQEKSDCEAYFSSKFSHSLKKSNIYKFLRDYKISVLGKKKNVKRLWTSCDRPYCFGLSIEATFTTIRNSKDRHGRLNLNISSFLRWYFSEQWRFFHSNFASDLTQQGHLWSMKESGWANFMVKEIYILNE